MFVVLCGVFERRAFFGHDDERAGVGVVAMEEETNVTHLDPSLVLHVKGVITRLAAAIDLMSFARRSEVIGIAVGRSLPVLHLDDGRRRENGRGRSGNRHERRR